MSIMGYGGLHVFVLDVCDYCDLYMRILKTEDVYIGLSPLPVTDYYIFSRGSL